MAIIGRERRLYINDVMLPCTRSLDVSFEQPINELRIKERYNATTTGIVRDQIDEQSCTIQIAGVLMDNYINIDTLLDILQSKSEANIELRYKDEVGAKNLKFVGLIDAYSDNDEGIIEFNGTIQSSGNIIKGTVIAPPIFTFTTQKVGTVNITTSGNNTFQDGNGNTLVMPYDRVEGDSDTILMYGDAVNTLTTLNAVNCQLIGDYDFSGWTDLQNANLEGNAFDSLTFVDSQFNNGTLNVINSLVEGAKFSQFIQDFDSVMTTSRSSVLDVGTIDDPLMLQPGSPEYSAITSLQSKGWLVSVVSNKLLTATIGSDGNITPSATLTAQGSPLHTLNGVAVSNISFGDINPNEFEVKTGNIIECWYANPTGDLFGLSDILMNDCKVQYFYLERLLNESTITLEAKRNVFDKTSINILKSYLDLDTVNGDDYTSTMTININSLQVGNLYSLDDYYNEIVNYQHSDRLISYVLRAEIDTNTPTGFETEGNFIVDSNRNRDVLRVQLQNGAIKNEFVDYWNEQFLCNNNPNLLTTKIYGQNVKRVDFYSTGIVSADLSNSNLNSARLYFYNCISLTSLTVGTGSVTSGGVQIYGTSLVNLDFSTLTFSVSVFRVYNNKLLESLIVGSGNFSGTFWVYKNKLSSIDIDNCILTSDQTYFYDNNLTSITFNSSSSLIADLFAYNNNLNDQDWSNISLNLSNFRVQNNPNCNNIDVATGSNLGTITKDAQTTINYI